MKKQLSFLILCASLSTAAPAFENELAFRTATGSFEPDAEWTFLISQGVGFGELSLENVLYQPILKQSPDSLVGEATLTFGIQAPEWLGIASGGRLVYGSGSSIPIILGVLSPTFTLESIGLEVSDDNELAYDLSAQVASYTNTVGLTLPVRTISGLEMSIISEYEGSMEISKGSSWEDGIEAGLAFAKSSVSFSLLWSASIRPDVEHGIKLALAHSF